tara:strand:- start:2993 stop:3625 length:633 start_codon:yes stop_codon:yes gene_type:complete
MCVACAESNGYYCGDDPANWTQYAPLGCVQEAWLNDGWEDCVDAEDENGAVPTTIEECAPEEVPCDTVYVDIPVIEYEYITEYDTIVEYETIIETQYITQIVIDTLEVEVFVPEYIYVTDTVYADVLDTMYIDVIEYVEVIVYDTIVEVEYVEFIVTEYIDCNSGLPCNSGIEEILDKSNQTGLMYNILGQPIKRPESIYIEDGKIKYRL